MSTLNRIEKSCQKCAVLLILKRDHDCRGLRTSLLLLHNRVSPNFIEVKCWNKDAVAHRQILTVVFY